jgi:phospholipid/cholesterol/gamma-HCH transport system substrate-binding protein
MGMSGIERFYSPPEIGAPGRREGFRRRRDLLFAGLFSLAMLVALLVSVVLLFGLTGEKISLTTECPASGGVQPGTPVMQADYLIGKVISVEPKMFGEKKGPPFKLSLQIDRQWRVSAQDKFVIGPAGLLQGNVVNLVSSPEPGTGAADLASAHNGMLKCEVESGLIEKVDPIIASIKRQIEALEGFLVTKDTDSADSQQSIAGILENLRDISDNLKLQMAAINPQEVGAIVGSARATARNVEQITATLTRRSAEIDNAVADFGQLADRLNRLVEKNDPKIERSLSDTQYMLQELATAMTPILNNLDETSQNLKELSLDLRNNPAAALWGRDVQDNTPGSRP